MASAWQVYGLQQSPDFRQPIATLGEALDRQELRKSMAFDPQGNVDMDATIANVARNSPQQFPAFATLGSQLDTRREMIRQRDEAIRQRDEGLDIQRQKALDHFI